MSKRGRNNNRGRGKGRGGRGRKSGPKRGAPVDRPAPVVDETQVDNSTSDMENLVKAWHVHPNLIFEASEIPTGDKLREELALNSLQPYAADQHRVNLQVWRKRSINKAIEAPNAVLRAKAVKFIRQNGYEAFLNIGGRDVVTSLTHLSQCARSALLGIEEAHYGEESGIPVIFKNGEVVKAYDFDHFEHYVKMYLDNKQESYQDNGPVSFAVHVAVGYIMDNRTVFGAMTKKNLEKLSPTMNKILSSVASYDDDNKVREFVREMIVERVLAGKSVLDINVDMLREIFYCGVEKAHNMYLKLPTDQRPNRKIKVPAIRSAMQKIVKSPIHFNNKRLCDVMMDQLFGPSSPETMVIDPNNYSNAVEKLRRISSHGELPATSIVFNLINFSPPGGAKNWVGVYEMVARASRLTYADDNGDCYYPDVYLMLDIAKCLPMQTPFYASGYQMISSKDLYAIFMFDSGFAGAPPTEVDGEDVIPVLDEVFFQTLLSEYADRSVQYIEGIARTALGENNLVFPFAYHMEADGPERVMPEVGIIEISQTPAYVTSSMTVRHTTSIQENVQRRKVGTSIEVDYSLYDTKQALVRHLVVMRVPAREKKTILKEYAEYARTREISQEISHEEIQDYSLQGVDAEACVDEQEEGYQFSDGEYIVKDESETPVGRLDILSQELAGFGPIDERLVEVLTPRLNSHDEHVTNYEQKLLHEIVHYVNASEFELTFDELIDGHLPPEAVDTCWAFPDEWFSFDVDGDDDFLSYFTNIVDSVQDELATV